MPCCTYVADVIIPPRRYKIVVKENLLDNDGDTDEAPTHTESVPIPLDVESVILRLWPVAEPRANIK
jgi:hypothetical protein